MAANGDNNDQGAEGQWPFDPWMLPDDFDAVMDLLDDFPSPPAVAPTQNVTTGSYGGNPFDWMAIPGSETTKLCIHGAATVFYHATLEVYIPNPEGSALALAHQSFIDFRDRDYVWVKHYLMDYAQQRAGGGYTVVHDSISDFHYVLCTSMAGGVPLADDGHREVAEPGEEADNNVVDHQQVSADAGDAIQPMIEQDDMPTASGPSQPNNAVEEQQQQDVVRSPGKSILAIQRDRTSKLELRDISRFFHLTIEKASKELRVGTTALKSISRKFGVPCWPYRTSFREELDEIKA
ncbi:hypothetical protein QOZ80_5AG0386170 [Eleusine coracana subsp. coracana]|nr:hypothetical protein QOZ80_5AG0386170 [Eleusine coracana subsp. coracana]